MYTRIPARVWYNHWNSSYTYARTLFSTYYYGNRLVISLHTCIQNRIPAFQSLSKNTYIETKMSQFVQRIANYIANVRTDE